MKAFVVISSVLLLQACAGVNEPMAVLEPSPEFAPVYPLSSNATRPVTGGIYSNRPSDSWFGRGRNYQVGDLITVLLNESTQAARTQNSDISRESKNTATPSGLNTELGKLNPVLKGIDLSQSAVDSKGKGTADQKASLVGSVTVTVIDILANGNLVVRGEKQLALTEGGEIIQVSGIVRTDDIAPNNTVQSRRLANAQIVYRGSGDLANATKAGWGTSALLKFWPF